MRWILFILINSWDNSVGERGTLAKQGDEAARKEGCGGTVGSGRTVRTDERGSEMLIGGTVLPSFAILPVGATTTVLLLPYAGVVERFL
jgi:hypothetical protein